MHTVTQPVKSYDVNSPKTTHREVFPDIGVSVFPQTFVVKSVDLRDLTGLVVPSQDGDALAVPNLLWRIKKIISISYKFINAVY